MLSTFNRNSLSLIIGAKLRYKLQLAISSLPRNSQLITTIKISDLLSDTSRVTTLQGLQSTLTFRLWLYSTSYAMDYVLLITCS